MRSSLRESPVLSGPLADFLWIRLYPVHVGRSLARSQKRAPVRYSKPLSRRAVWERKTAGQKLSLEINSILHPPFRDVEATTQSDEDFLEDSILQAIAVKFLTHRRRKTWAQCGVCSNRQKNAGSLILMEILMAFYTTTVENSFVANLPRFDTDPWQRYGLATAQICHEVWQTPPYSVL